MAIKQKIKFNDLSDEQKKVVTSLLARLVTYAVAGAGKTTALRASIQRYINQGIDPESILVLCFGTKTVEELQSRLPSGVTVSTFHGFANSLLRKKLKNIRVPNQGQLQRILRVTIQKNPKLCRSISAYLDLEKDKNVSLLLKFYNATHGDQTLEKRFTEEESSFTELAVILPKLRKLYVRFVEKLRNEKFVSFPDMLELGRRALAEESFEYSHLFVDEYQDMDAAQLNFLVALAEEVEVLRVFGDPSQAIFSFLGSQSVDVAKALGAKTAKLSISHRLSHQTAATAAAILQDKGRGRIAIKGARDGELPVFTSCRSQQEQEKKIVSLIQQLTESGVDEGQIAILARSRRQLRLLERILRNEGYPVNPSHRPQFLDHVEKVLDLVNYVEKYQDRLREGELSKTEKQKIESMICKKIDIELEEDQAKSSRRLLTKAARAGSRDGMYCAVKRMYLSAMGRDNPDKKGVRNELNIWEPIVGRFKLIKKFREFLVSSYDGEGITLSTIHSAKGMEWEHVILPDITDGVIPHFREIRRNNIEEERRLFYVAVTRAKSRVYLFSTPVTWEKAIWDEPSRFLTRGVARTVISKLSFKFHGA